MYTISVWVSRHVWPSRIALVLLYVLLTLLGLFIGAALQLFQILIPLFFFYLAVILFLSVFLLYPEKYQRHRFTHFYRYQKTCDFVLVAATFYFIVCLGNQPQQFLHFGTQSATASTFSPQIGVAAKSSTVAEKMIHPQKLSKKALRHVLFKKIRVLHKTYKDTSVAGKIALILLSLIVAVVVGYGIVGISCSLACAGSEGFALIVLILGGGLIIFFLVRVIRRILKGPKQSNPDKPS
jgi:hypothetical protein